MIAGVVIGALVFGAAASGGLYKPGPWYRALNRPAWTPPDWLFPVVWTPLYLMIGYAGWLVWQADNLLAISLWGAQLLANGAWSWLFFGRRQMRLAFVDLGMLWLLIWSFVAVTAQTQATAALMFVPYGIWVSIAGMLNLRMIQLNPLARA
ncbi:MAG: TspO/MBR family protein [Lysobacterales bacterium]